MYYLEVLVGDATYHGNEPLTYSCDRSLPVGALVIAPLRNRLVLGMVVGRVTKPSFAAKPIASVPALPPLPLPTIKLLQWMRSYYPAPLGIITQLFLPKQLPKHPLPPTGFPALGSAALPPLRSEQKQAVAAMREPGLHMLHGETGTGKTRVYIELAQQCLGAGRSAIILTPEIGLTSQLANDFRQAFGKRVIVVHSQLTDAVRQRIWQQLLEQTDPVVVIGARSALFSPLRQIGLIVVDESHENAYKQDQAPYYHATIVAAKLAALHDATLILGSATPLVADYYVAKAKKRPIIRMRQPAANDAPTDVDIHIIDLRDRANFSKSPFLSTKLIHAIGQTIARREQALIFLNRRGTARVIFCDKCGWQALCPHCDVPLIYHGDIHCMRCHSCDYKTASPSSCPTCHNTSIIFKSIGTKAVVAELERLFMSAKIMRFDADNKKSERIEQHYDAVRRGDVDIIVGTQTLAKGLDLPLLSLVGVVAADTSLYFPDFSAQERTYQLLSQVIGRVGRGHRDGRVYIQTYIPDSALLAAVLHKNWRHFYDKEVIERQTFGFPPFCYLLKLSCRRASSASAQAAANKLAAELRQMHRDVTIEGPAPSFHEKVQNKFVWQIILKSSSRSRLAEIIRGLPSGWSYDTDPMNLL